MIKNLWQYRLFIFKSATNELKERYVGTSVGFMWNIISPLLQIVIYSLVFSQLMMVKMPGLSNQFSFAIYICSGLLPWIAFNESVSRGTNTFIENASYLKKLPIPENIFIAKTVVTSLLSLLVSVFVLFIFNLTIGGEVYLSWLLLPCYLLLLLLFAYGLAVILATLNVFFRDISQIINVVLQAWMWMTPIVYIVEILPKNLQDLIYYNPLYYFINPIQKAILSGEMASIQEWVAMIGFPIFIIILGHYILGKLRSEIRDVI